MVAPSAEATAPESDVEPGPVESPARETRTLPERARFDRPRWVMLRSLLVPGWGQAHNHAWIKTALLVAGDGSLRWRLVRDERRLNDLGGKAAGRLADLTDTEARAKTARTGLTTAQDRVAAAQVELAAAQTSGDPARIAAAEAELQAANLGLIDAGNAYDGATEAFGRARDAYSAVVGVYNALLDVSVNRRWLAAGVVVYALLDAYVDAHFRYFDLDFRLDPALPGGGRAPGARLRLGWRF
jgi:hypothetical protein